eukprot:3028534-Amphidinium_carterae.1
MIAPLRLRFRSLIRCPPLLPEGGAAGNLIELGGKAVCGLCPPLRGSQKERAGSLQASGYWMGEASSAPVPSSRPRLGSDSHACGCHGLAHASPATIGSSRQFPPPPPGDE